MPQATALASAPTAGLAETQPAESWEAAGGSSAGMSCRTAEAFGSSDASVSSARGDGAGVRSSGGDGSQAREASGGPPSASAQQDEQQNAQHIVDGTKLRHGWMCAPLQAHWSDYYKRTPREPSNTEVASWVIKRHAARRRAR